MRKWELVIYKFSRNHHIDADFLNYMVRKIEQFCKLIDTHYIFGSIYQKNKGECRNVICERMNKWRQVGTRQLNSLLWGKIIKKETKKDCTVQLRQLIRCRNSGIHIEKDAESCCLQRWFFGSKAWTYLEI